MVCAVFVVKFKSNFLMTGPIPLYSKLQLPMTLPSQFNFAPMTLPLLLALANRNQERACIGKCIILLAKWS